MKETSLEESKTASVLSDIYEPISSELDDTRGHIEQIARRLLLSPNDYASLRLTAGGKLIRPALLLFSARLCEAEDLSFFTRMAASSELIHLATLIHDDVVDSAQVRRGIASFNARWDNRLAVLCGDRVLSQAFTMLGYYRNIEIVDTMVKHIDEMVAGEIRQTLLDQGRRCESLGDYLEVIRAKTGSLMSAVCKLPALLMSVEEHKVSALELFGMNFGIAFQIVDDLLDVWADEKTLGKPCFSDLQEGKTTLPILHLCSALPPGSADQARIGDLFKARKVSEEDKDWLVRLLARHNTNEYCLEQARSYISAAKEALTVFPDASSRQSLFDLADFIIDREK